MGGINRAISSLGWVGRAAFTVFTRLALLDLAVDFLGRGQDITLEQRMHWRQALAIVVALNALALGRVHIDEAAKQGIGLLKARAQLRVGQTLFHGQVVAGVAQVAAGFIDHITQVQLGVLPVQSHSICRHGAHRLARLEVIPDPHRHAHQQQQGKHQQHHAQHLYQPIFQTAQYIQHRKFPYSARPHGLSSY